LGSHIANFQFGRPWAGEGPDLDWSCRTCCRTCRTLTGHPCTGLLAAAGGAGQSCPGPRAPAHGVASAVVIPARQSRAKARQLNLPGRGSYPRPHPGIHDRTATAGAGLYGRAGYRVPDRNRSSVASKWSSLTAIETVAGSLSRGPAAPAEVRVWFGADNVVMYARFPPGIILGRKDVNSAPTRIFSSTGSNV
jgi:hypothetical protein